MAAAQEQPWQALPQRPPRERRPAKRARAAEEQCAQPVGTADALPAAAAAEPQPAYPATAAAAAAAAADQAAGEGEQQPAGEQQEQQPAAAGQQDGGGEEADATPAAAQLDLPAYRSAAVRDHKFEYLDHTADVQLHAWGATLAEAIENCGLCMFNYMTPLKGIAVDPALTRTYEAEGHDLQSLLFNFLDELLFAFATEFFVAKQLRVTHFDREAFRITAEGQGERFDRQRHVCGTEVKAITYSAMQINETAGDAEVFVIVDI